VAEAWFDELAELVRIPSVSADAARAGDVHDAAEWLAAFVRGAGGEADVVETETHPLIIGELAASNGATAPTVLVYGHVDVQPPDPLELWETDPFTLEQRGEWLYGRGVADDKGQLYMLVKAATELAAAGLLVDRRRRPVGGKDRDGSDRDLVDLVDEDRALRLQVAHDVQVVHDLFADVDGRAVLVERPLDGLHRTLDPRAVAARCGEQHDAMVRGVAHVQLFDSMVLHRRRRPRDQRS